MCCPKYRRPVLGGPVAVRCEELIRAKAWGHTWRMVAVKIMNGHVHLFMKAHPSDSPSYVASQVTGFTSRRLRPEFPRLRSRLPTLWSGSYVAATAGAVCAKMMRRHLAPQDGRRWLKERAQ
jgi:putative transposase